jgi:hypothetical protein
VAQESGETKDKEGVEETGKPAASEEQVDKPRWGTKEDIRGTESGGGGGGTETQDRIRDGSK